LSVASSSSLYGALVIFIAGRGQPDILQLAGPLLPPPSAWTKPFYFSLENKIKKHQSVADFFFIIIWK
jgi:hypothetical protein